MALARNIRDRFFPGGPSSVNLKFRHRYLDLNQVPTNVPKSTDAVPLPQYTDTQSMNDFVVSVLSDPAGLALFARPADIGDVSDFFIPLNMFESKRSLSRAPGKKNNLDMFGLVAAVATDNGLSPTAGSYETPNINKVKKMRLDEKLRVSKSTKSKTMFGERPNQAVNLKVLIEDIATEVLGL